MAEAILGDHDQYSCSICLELLRDPVTIPCGHSYCMSCINECWNTNDQKGKYRCPQCRHTFNSKPPLNRSTVLAEIMEKLRSTESAQSLAGPGEIACDFCSGEMIKAVKSCLECRASYCETHVQPHYNVPALKKHKLVKAAVIPVCPKHDKFLEVYCRTDQKCVCMHCLLDDHKGHDTVPSTIERNEKQIKLTHSQTNVKQTIQAKEKELQKMKMDITSHSDSAKKAVENSKKVLSELVKLIEKKSNEVIEEIKAQEKADLDHGTKLQKKLEGEITELKKREGVLEDLLQTEDNIQFLQNYETVSSSSGSDELQSFSFQPYCSFEDVRKRICELIGRLETTCTQEISKTVNKVSDLSAKRPPFDIVVGERVRVKPSVVTPIHKWGSVTHLSVGVVKKIQGDLLTVDFPEQRNWTGVVSEMEHVSGAGSDLSTKNGPFDIDVGDRVRVKPSITTPKHNWGRNVTHKSVGVVKDIKDDDSVVVDFPGHANWKGILTEMELVTNDDDEIGPSSLDSNIKIGDKVRVKPSVVSPTHKWGAVTHKSIGVVKKIQGDSLTVDFPEQKNWTGIVSEMEIVASADSDLSTINAPIDIKVGDKVRVKFSITTPKPNWGADVTHKSVGVVKGIKCDDSLIFDFPEHANWKGILSEMDIVTNNDDFGSSSLESVIKIGDQVCVKMSVVTPTHKWGAVTHKSIGVVQIDIKVGDRVRVKSSIITPKHNWGGHVTHKSVGVVKDIKSEDVIVDFPNHKSWKGILSEMELVNYSDSDISGSS
ncbi:tripartite motif-containing protein 65 isoform X2 [Sinocyclocheilus anshuiensis]|uniref:tripartite motif-containing protein 65 isoform X2 n=1 Tax=Sinocyclocheilus anshuiensis TaxID=1608454 RepID=UPI0007BABE3C|nr:PREDICTED: tripartite motif-containing protein 65-like isoform X2 [Sinocyclocheilus anshuiensis]